jgi:hypothetical protein
LPGSRNCQHSGCGLGRYVKSGRAFDARARPGALKSVSALAETNGSKSACDVKTHLDAFLWNPRRGAAFAPSRGYLEFPTELLVRINITDIKIMDIRIMDIKIMDIKILNINIMDIKITDKLGSFRQGFEGACASRAREFERANPPRCGIALSASRTDGIRFSI